MSPFPYNLRAQFLLDPDVVFLNHGSFGATPRTVFESYQRWQRELERQPVEFIGRRLVGLLRESRMVLADYLGTSADDLVYVTNVTTGFNTIARSMVLEEGDEVLATNHEYGAIDRVWRFMSCKQGFNYINHSISFPLKSTNDLLEEFWQGVTPRTRIISISHITSPTAVIFPVKEICQRARREGILTVIDGAHVPGQLSLDLEDLGADFYVGNLHKWLCAPKGAGFLYARPDMQRVLEPLVVSWGWESDWDEIPWFAGLHEFTGTRDPAAFLAVPDAIAFQRDNDWDAVRQECHVLLQDTLECIQSLTGFGALYSLELGCLPPQMGVALLPDDTDMEVLRDALYDRYRVEVPLMEWGTLNLIRVSIQGYNTAADIDTLISALKNLL